MALGGRYDEVGRSFGRARPATGFSLDLRQLARQAPQLERRPGIRAPHGHDAALMQRVRALRDSGEIVVVDLPGHSADVAELGCDRQLEFVEGEWQIVSLDRKV
ncbi:ATP phosphoribosyltransferase regulatory subunit [Methyloversatilis sp.]|uniref:ATP phosphoribosyltransferase regulatory subunit n=1 Tax=Methyloversatilis sp. TaxID=2569862 RepID=UPI0035239439